MPETIHILGEGGGIHAMDLPLPDPIEQRLRKGMLKRVNADGTPYTGPAPEPAAETDGETDGDGTGEDSAQQVRVPDPGQQAPGPPLARPGQNAPKADWVGWAVVCGADPEHADGMTKADLIEQYGQK